MKKTTKKKPKPLSDIDICKILESHEDENVRKLVMFLRDIKKAYMMALNDKSRLSAKLDKLTKEGEKQHEKEKRKT